MKESLIAIAWHNNVPPIKLESFADLEKLSEKYDVMTFTSNGERKIYFDEKGKRFAVR